MLLTDLWDVLNSLQIWVLGSVWTHIWYQQILSPLR